MSVAWKVGFCRQEMDLNGPHFSELCIALESWEGYERSETEKSGGWTNGYG